MPTADGRDVVVVTGAGGMGEAIARRIGAGRTVVLADFDETQLQAAVGRLAALGHTVYAVRTDVSDAAEVDALARAAAERGVVRSVVHTAGVSPVQATSAQIVAVDVVGTARLLDAFLPLVAPGTVAICIASMAASMMPVEDDVVRALATHRSARGVARARSRGTRPGHRVRAREARQSSARRSGLDCVGTARRSCRVD
jgi:NAD(P)-dependent dehydrogenase (short-subunit alcohol dehydrogenase family)